jgi:CheY-like chemotaxis protein
LLKASKPSGPRLYRPMLLGRQAAQADSADGAVRAVEESRPDAPLVDVALPDRDRIALAGVHEAKAIRAATQACVNGHAP